MSHKLPPRKPVFQDLAQCSSSQCLWAEGKRKQKIPSFWCQKQLRKQNLWDTFHKEIRQKSHFQITSSLVTAFFLPKLSAILKQSSCFCFFTYTRLQHTLAFGCWRARTVTLLKSAPICILYSLNSENILAEHLSLVSTESTVVLKSPWPKRQQKNELFSARRDIPGRRILHLS